MFSPIASLPLSIFLCVLLKPFVTFVLNSFLSFFALSSVVETLPSAILVPDYWLLTSLCPTHYPMIHKPFGEEEEEDGGGKVGPPF